MNEAYRELLETLRHEAEASQDPETRERLRFALEAFHHIRRRYLMACEADGETVIH